LGTFMAHKQGANIMDRNEIEVTRLNEQIADLKAELVELSGKVRDGIDEVERAARPAIGVIRDNPGTISSVAVTAGLVGLAVGYLLGSSTGTPTSRWN
jgi:ElaB/YqjD/DUF883 family membrane-anchored ribosome-binding protein